MTAEERLATAMMEFACTLLAEDLAPPGKAPVTVAVETEYPLAERTARVLREGRSATENLLAEFGIPRAPKLSARAEATAEGMGMVFLAWDADA